MDVFIMRRFIEYDFSQDNVPDYDAYKYLDGTTKENTLMITPKPDNQSCCVLLLNDWYV